MTEKSDKNEKSYYKREKTSEHSNEIEYRPNPQDLANVLGPDYMRYMNSDGSVNISMVPPEKLSELKERGLIEDLISRVVPITTDLANALGPNISMCMTDGKIDLSKIDSETLQKLSDQGLIKLSEAEK